MLKILLIINVTNNTIQMIINWTYLNSSKKVKIFSSVDGIGDLCESSEGW